MVVVFVEFVWVLCLFSGLGDGWELVLGVEDVCGVWRWRELKWEWVCEDEDGVGDGSDWSDLGGVVMIDVICWFW